MTASSTGTAARAIAVTGANGYVGGAIVAALANRGIPVVRLQRSGTGAGVRHAALGAPVDPSTFQDVDALVHCAYDVSATDWSEIHRLNVEGSLALFRAARAAGVRTVVLISSMSAFEGCRSMYGRAKLAVEHAARELGVQSVRPGLVYGDRSGGMVGSLGQLLRLPLVTPLVGTGSQVLYLAHEADLGDLVGRIATGEYTPGAGAIIAAHERPYTFREILSVLARRAGRRTRFVPVPWRLEWLALRTAELAGLRIRLRSDSLVSLVNQDPHPPFTPALPVRFRDFESFMTGAAGADGGSVPAAAPA